MRKALPYTKKILAISCRRPKNRGIRGNDEFCYYLACSKGVFGAWKLRIDLTKGEIR
jgi:hypothetical protein